jgi:hypothetical protein
MRKRVQIAVAVLLVAIAGVVIWRALRPQEPVYQGKPLSSWLIASTTTGTPQAQEQANAAVRQVGTNALPTLLRMLRVKDSPLKVKLMALADKQHVVKIRYTSAEKWNVAAFHAFLALGTNAQSAAPALPEIANENISHASRAYAISALGAIGPPASEALPSLFRWATNADADVRFSAFWSLAEIGAELDRVVPLLTNALRDPYYAARAGAVEALGKLGADAKIAVPALVVPLLTNVLHDPSLSIQRMAVEALGKFGPDAKIAVPALVELLNASTGFLREGSTNALKKIDPQAAARAGVK